MSDRKGIKQKSVCTFEHLQWKWCIIINSCFKLSIILWNFPWNPHVCKFIPVSISHSDLQALTNNFHAQSYKKLGRGCCYFPNTLKAVGRGKLWSRIRGLSERWSVKRCYLYPCLLLISDQKDNISYTTVLELLLSSDRAISVQQGCCQGLVLFWHQLGMDESVT